MSDPAQYKIFICYRHNDGIGTTNHIYDLLEAHFGEHTVFMDNYAIPVASDFRQTAIEALNTCSVALIVIGPHWFTIATPDGEHSGVPRLANPEDNVRVEVEKAFERPPDDLLIIPLLIEGAVMPDASALSESIRDIPSIRSLTRRNGFTIRSDRNFRDDVNRLIEIIAKRIGVPVISGFSPTRGPIGTEIRISGSGFTGITDVTLNGTSITFTVVSDGEIRVTVTSGATSGSIILSAPGGTATSSASFTVGDEPPPPPPSHLPNHPWFFAGAIVALAIVLLGKGVEHWQILDAGVRILAARVLVYGSAAAAAGLALVACVQLARLKRWGWLVGVAILGVLPFTVIAFADIGALPYFFTSIASLVYGYFGPKARAKPA